MCRKHNEIVSIQQWDRDNGSRLVGRVYCFFMFVIELKFGFLGFFLSAQKYQRLDAVVISIKNQ